MHEDSGSAPLSSGQFFSRLGVLLGVSSLVGVAGVIFGLNPQQTISCSVFIGIIMGTLLFWNLRLAIAFIGLSLLIFSNSINIPTFIQSASLEVILFLVGMMVVVGALRDLGFFTWIVQLIVSMPNLNGKKFIAVTAVSSALMACAVDEVTSIIFISSLIFQVCDRLKLNPTPYIIICVFATNVGSAGTMMGNPVGIYIGTKAGLTFTDFIVWAFPIMLVALALVVILTMWFFRKDLAIFDRNLKERIARNLSLVPTIEVPYKQGLVLLLATVSMIASHSHLEILFGLGKNSVLLIAPLLCAGIVMIIKRNRARYYIENEVDWWTLLFFMLLFAVAGTLEHTNVDKIMAGKFSEVCGTENVILIPLVMTVSALGSAFVDNVIFVAAFCPVISKLSIGVKDLPLWWALLFGACFGGNITMIGSTANIVALGMLEKRSHVHVMFFQWLKIGILASLLTGGFACLALYALSPLMPDRYAMISMSDFQGCSTPLTNKNAIIKADIDHNSKATWLKPEDQAQYSSITLKIFGEKRQSISFIAYLPKDMSIESNGAEQFFKGKISHTGREDFPAILVVEEILSEPTLH
ncbi:MAG: SLC13 family permease [Victivallaceae bacterium]|nr:SLC13 family permease [Victivallaceae bacterium]MDD3116445.1 SLC13 family permease [Victivallaceae bacterium]MDD3703757.1 SLC13 family permease [Victivallaceae bacterium]MDD4318076.1 SLC13 family permease [Victivallaceae bacterium]MDD5664330.1 SLC13 family permease [Victivallaceae bacterium]